MKKMCIIIVLVEDLNFLGILSMYKICFMHFQDSSLPNVLAIALRHLDSIMKILIHGS